jgi:hypothetical protein
MKLFKVIICNLVLNMRRQPTLQQPRISNQKPNLEGFAGKNDIPNVGDREVEVLDEPCGLVHEGTCTDRIIDRSPQMVNLITVATHLNRRSSNHSDQQPVDGGKYIVLINYRKCGLRGHGTGHGAFLRSHASLRAGSCCRRR